jgi:hypothetical protein
MGQERNTVLLDRSFLVPSGLEEPWLSFLGTVFLSCPIRLTHAAMIADPISWRGDGAYVAVNSLEAGSRRVIRVYSREGTLETRRGGVRFFRRTPHRSDRRVVEFQQSSCQTAASGTLILLCLLSSFKTVYSSGQQATTIGI